jgi:hypothetical protein
MSRLTRKRERQWARYANHYEPTSHPAVGGRSFLRTVWRGIYRQDSGAYKYIRRQAKQRPQPIALQETPGQWVARVAPHWLPDSAP